MTYRIMVEQETGEEMCVKSGVTSEEKAWELVEKTMEEHTEFRSGWIESESRYSHLYF